MNEIDRRIKLSNKIYPYLSGLSSDLLFLAAINTIFLTTVKMLSASQISLLSAISILITIISQGLVLKIIKKIGNIKSVRLGLLMLFIGAILITFGNSFITIGLLYGTLETAQNNGKIFIQYFMQNYESIEKTAIYLTVIIAFSRVARVLSDLSFNKIYDKIKNKFIIVLNIVFILALAFIICGSFISQVNIAMIVMGFGFCMILWARDPIMNFLKNALLDNCSKENQQTAMLKFNLSRRIVKCILSALFSLLLLKVDIFYVMILLLVLALVYLNITMKLYKMI